MKKIAVALMTAAAAAAMSMTALAGSWNWIDINNDGVQECYYLADNDMFLTDTTTPDGYQVNAQGQWTENGVVQTKGQATSQVSSNIAGMPDGTYDVYPIEAAEWFSSGKIVISNHVLTFHSLSSSVVYNYVGFSVYRNDEGNYAGDKYQTADGSKIMWVFTPGYFTEIDVATGSSATVETEEEHKWVDGIHFYMG